MDVAVFASSLLSLILPWARSPAPHSPLSLRCPRPVAPPPLPRRHSDPTHTTTPNNKHILYSDTKNPKLDLRQELQNLDLNKQDFVKWLGNEFEENDEEFDTYYEQLTHNIPLQKSISLERDVDISNYFYKIGSDWSGTEVGSSWSTNSDEYESLVFEQYRSFEDIPVSLTVKSRRVSDIDTFRQNLAVSVLKDSYKSMDTSSGNISPQIKILQRCYAFPDKLEEFKEAIKSSVENIDDVFKKSEAPANSKDFGNKGGLHRVRMLHRRLSFKATENSNKSNDGKLEVRIPFYRSISMDQLDPNNEGTLMESRQRKKDLTDMCQWNKNEAKFRKEVLLKRNRYKFKSYDSISVKRLHSPRVLAEKTLFCDGLTGIGGISPLQKYKHAFSYINPTVIVPTIVITDTDCRINVAKNKNSRTSIKESAITTSNNVDIKCDCRVCTDVVSGSSFVRKMLSKLFVKIVSHREIVRDRRLDRRFTYRDENNNDSDMQKCIMNVLKLLLGLWLRHLDHN